MVVLVVLPEIAPGLRVQLPAGNPVSITLPVATEQVGWVIVLNWGGDGITGCGFITTLTDDVEVQPEALVTVNVYEPAANPVIVLLLPVPEIEPGFMVQFPAGKSFKVTLPVETVHVGWIMAPTVGAIGVAGCGLITLLAEGDDSHPIELVTV